MVEVLVMVKVTVAAPMLVGIVVVVVVDEGRW